MWMPRQTHPPTDNRRDCPTYLQKEIQKRTPPSISEGGRPPLRPVIVVAFRSAWGTQLKWTTEQVSSSSRSSTIIPPWVALVRVERKVVGPSKIEASVEDEFLGAVAADKDSSSSSNNKRGWMMSREAGHTDGRTKPITGRQRMDRGTGRQQQYKVTEEAFAHLAIHWMALLLLLLPRTYNKN